jgi:RsiW-degrading membrane proteinase PrsW (M82 family)
LGGRRVCQGGNNSVIENVIPLLVSLTAPLLLIPIEKIFPYPHLIEEPTKLLIVLVILTQEKQFRRPLVWVAFLAGVFFTLSESAFYLINIFALGDLSVFPVRLLATGMLHVGTIMLMYAAARKKNLAVLAFAFFLSILIHFGYNLWMASMYLTIL